MIYPLSFPNIGVSSEKLQIILKQSGIPSPFTGHQQTVTNYAQWGVSWTWPVMRLGRAETAQGWLDSLQGQLGSFLYQPRQSVQSGLTGRTLAGNAYVYGNTVTVGGWSAGGVSTLRVGQYFQIGTQLLRIVSAPLNADANGRCVIEFAPFLRSAFNAGTPVNFVNPKSLFRLASSETPAFTLTTNKTAEFPAIDAMEAL
ncbi:MAG: hypothetical protein ABW128_21835 [Rhizorhabdus sp.]